MPEASPLDPSCVIPHELARVLTEGPTWFVIGGQAVRCIEPYRPSRDVDLGVAGASDLAELVATLERSGDVEIRERADDTVHLSWNGIDVSIFVLPSLAAYAPGRRLGVTGLLATKLHAIVDRGTRRDFFDLYVILEHERLGILEAIRAIRRVYGQDVEEGLLLRALTYFDDAEREAPLPGEGAGDFDEVKRYFLERVGDLLVPPTRKLGIQANVVDVAGSSRGGQSAKGK